MSGLSICTITPAFCLIMMVLRRLEVVEGSILFHNLCDDCGADCSPALADREPLAFVDCQGVEEFAAEFDVVAWHDHLAVFVFGAIGPEEAAGFIWITCHSQRRTL